MERMRKLLLVVMCLAVASPALAQFGGLISQGAKRAKQVNDFRWTEEEKANLGAAVSEKVRQRYGVVQNQAVHRYVTLVGLSLTQRSSKPDLPWTFIVLDTDAVNAFAAPHGYVHITKGALALARNEAELAGVLAHEIIHVSEEHTIKALRNQTLKSAAAEEALKNNGLLEFLADAAYNNILDNAYSRGDENDSDNKGIVLVNAAGYAPQGLGAFLTSLTERNKASTEKRGMFDSHPGMQARLDRLNGTITKSKLTATNTVDARYRKTIIYKPVPQAQVATVEAGTRGLAGGGSAKKDEPAADEAPKEEPKKRRFGLANLTKAGGGESKSAQVVGSGGARGLDPEKDAKGGGNPAVVAVTVTPADLEAFRKAGGLG
jgi:predicted Zn-dependent protease